MRKIGRGHANDSLGSLAVTDEALQQHDRFLINQPVNEATAPPITLLMNWNPAAKK